MSRNPWDAEISLHEADVGRLIGSQFPELSIERVQLAAEGWDNAVWLVNESWAFRFPRRSVAVPLLEAEIRILARLAPRLSLPIPVPQFIGAPGDGYPWPFCGAEWIEGQDLAGSGLPEERRILAARELGAFLRQLHNPTLAEAFAADLERRPERADVAQSMPQILERINAAVSAGLWNVPRNASDILDRAQELPAPTDVALVHGDLHVGHLLVGGDGRPTGVIDWGDACLAHPSVDLQIGWSGFSGEARDAFLAGYGEVPSDWRLRAAISALSYSATLAVYGHGRGLPRLVREAINGLDRAVDDP